MIEERNIQVINPQGVAWAVRFKTEEAAWSRLTALKGVSNTELRWADLRAEGWKVEHRDASERAA